MFNKKSRNNHTVIRHEVYHYSGNNPKSQECESNVLGGLILVAIIVIGVILCATIGIDDTPPAKFYNQSEPCKSDKSFLVHQD